MTIQIFYLFLERLETGNEVGVSLFVLYFFRPFACLHLSCRKRDTMWTMGVLFLLSTTPGSRTFLMMMNGSLQIDAPCGLYRPREPNGAMQMFITERDTRWHPAIKFINSFVILSTGNGKWFNYIPRFGRGARIHDRKKQPTTQRW